MCLATAAHPLGATPWERSARGIDVVAVATPQTGPSAALGERVVATVCLAHRVCVWVHFLGKRWLSFDRAPPDPPAGGSSRFMLVLRYITLHYITLHYILHYIVLHYITCYITLHCALHCIALHCIALRCIALHVALHCIALHCIALHCIALHCIALHCIA